MRSKTQAPYFPHSLFPNCGNEKKKKKEYPVNIEFCVLSFPTIIIKKIKINAYVLFVIGTSYFVAKNSAGAFSPMSCYSTIVSRRTSPVIELINKQTWRNLGSSELRKPSRRHYVAKQTTFCCKADDDHGTDTRSRRQFITKGRGLKLDDAT